MSKKLKDLQWQPVTLEGFPITNSNIFQGFIGLQECTDYDLVSERKKSKLVSFNFDFSVVLNKNLNLLLCELNMIL